MPYAKSSRQESIVLGVFYRDRIGLRGSSRLTNDQRSAMSPQERHAVEPELLALLRLKLEFDVPLTTAEAAALRGCAPETLVRERVRGGDAAPFIHVGRAVRYPARPFLAWLRDRPSCTSTSEKGGHSGDADGCRLGHSRGMGSGRP
jgi:hypothetical protein